MGVFFTPPQEFPTRTHSLRVGCGGHLPLEQPPLVYDWELIGKRTHILMGDGNSRGPVVMPVTEQRARIGGRLPPKKSAITIFFFGFFKGIEIVLFMLYLD